MDFWGLTVPAIIGAVAWIYQRAWDRQQRRIERYETILDSLPGFWTLTRSTRH
jgi:hypothetical protein